MFNSVLILLSAKGDRQVSESSQQRHQQGETDFQHEVFYSFPF